MSQTPPLPPDEKALHRELGHAYNRLAAVGAALTAIAGVFGSPVDILFPALASAGFWFQSDVEGKIADDPPDTKYKIKVRIRSRRSRLPKPGTSEAAMFLRLYEYADYLRQTSRALLRSAERLGGAEIAHDKVYIAMRQEDMERVRLEYIRASKTLLTLIERIAGTLRGSRQFSLATTTEWPSAIMKSKEAIDPKKLFHFLREAGLTLSESGHFSEWFSRRTWAKEIAHPINEEMQTLGSHVGRTIAKLDALYR